MELVQTVNSTYNEVNRNIHILEHEKLITQQHISHKRVIRLNVKNQETAVLLKAMKLLEHPNRHSATIHYENTEHLTT